MSVTQFDARAKKQELFDVLLQEFNKAHSEGVESLEAFFTTTAYCLGSFIPVAVEEQSFIPVLSGVIEDVTKGMETGIQAVGAKSTFTRIVRN
ncbi:hypothetical protein ABDI30_21645 [Paenibacillus cisolokensis]|uniref:hypothetical protein n=1 Tax=Paenibacillus cisolokensis TaxID=1658519 RepID=UPI003D296A4F